MAPVVVVERPKQEKVDEFISIFGGETLSQPRFIEYIEHIINTPFSCYKRSINIAHLAPGGILAEVREAAMLLARALAVYFFSSDPDNCTDISYSVANIAGVVKACHSGNKRMAKQMKIFAQIAREEIRRHSWLLDFWSNVSPQLVQKLASIDIILNHTAAASTARRSGELQVSAQLRETESGGIKSYPPGGSIHETKAQVKSRFATLDYDDVEYENNAIHDPTRAPALTSVAALYRQKPKEANNWD